MQATRIEEQAGRLLHLRQIAPALPPMERTQ